MIVTSYELAFVRRFVFSQPPDGWNAHPPLHSRTATDHPFTRSTPLGSPSSLRGLDSPIISNLSNRCSVLGSRFSVLLRGRIDVGAVWGSFTSKINKHATAPAPPNFYPLATPAQRDIVSMPYRRSQSFGGYYFCSSSSFVVLQSVILFSPLFEE